MTFEEFLDFCSVDFVDTDDKSKTKVLVIFTVGHMDEYSSDFVNSNAGVSKKLTAKTLYDYLKERFNE